MSKSKGERIAFQVRLPAELWKELKYFVADRRSTMGDEVVTAVERYLAEQRRAQAERTTAH